MVTRQVFACNHLSLIPVAIGVNPTPDNMISFTGCLSGYKLSW